MSNESESSSGTCAEQWKIDDTRRALEDCKSEPNEPGGDARCVECRGTGIDNWKSSLRNKRTDCNACNGTGTKHGKEG